MCSCRIVEVFTANSIFFMLKVAEFESVLRDYEKVYRSNNVMLTMGGDFTFQIAEAYFKNLDKLIK